MDWQHTTLIAIFFGGLLFQMLVGTLFGLIDGTFAKTSSKLARNIGIFDFINTIIFWTGSAVLLCVITGMKIYEYDILDDILGEFHIWAAGISGIVAAAIFWFILALAYIYSENKAFERTKKRQRVFLTGHSN